MRRRARPRERPPPTASTTFSWFPPPRIVDRADIHISVQRDGSGSPPGFPMPVACYHRRLQLSTRAVTSLTLTRRAVVFVTKSGAVPPRMRARPPRLISCGDRTASRAAHTAKEKRAEGLDPARPFFRTTETPLRRFYATVLTHRVCLAATHSLLD